MKKSFVALDYGRIEKRLFVTQCYINPFFQQHRGKYWVIEWFVEAGVHQILRSCTQIIFPAGFDGMGFSIRILLFRYMELGYPQVV
jgi:hypothetical protein